jgi:ubiquinone/menaquinone biosynthesis C-methylase UbiE
MISLFLLILIGLIIASIVTLVILRYILYKILLKYKPIERYDRELNKEYDEFYREYINNKKEGKSSIEIEADYNNLNLDSVDDSFNVCYLRKYLNSKPSDSTIELADLSDNQYILDCGCGTGKVAIYLCKKLKNVKIDCIVNSIELYKKCVENIKNEKLENEIKVFLMDFDNLEEPIKNNKYDRILFLESVDYSLDREKLIKNMYEILKDEGKLFIKTPCFKNKMNKDNKDLYKKLIQIWNYNFSCISSLIDDFKKSEFKDVKYISLNPVLCSIFLNPIDLYNLYCFIKDNKIKNKENLSALLLCIYEYNLLLATKNKSNIKDDNIEKKKIEKINNISLEILEK